jgi:hypothetical protein
MDPRPSDGMHRASRLVGQLVNAFPHVNGRHYRTLGLLRPAVVIGASGHGVGNESMPEPSQGGWRESSRTFAVPSGQCGRGVDLLDWGSGWLGHVRARS